MGKLERLLMIIPPQCNTAIPEMFAVCDALRGELGIDAHISFPSPYRRQKMEEHHHDFNAWVAAHEDAIRETSVVELEREYARSHLWKIVVAQRSMNDYSYLGGSYPYVRKTLEEHLFVLKALVTYYVALIKKYAFDAVLCEAPDNMHSTALFVLGRSLGVPTFSSTVVDYLPQHYFLLDSEFWHSALIRKTYADNLARYDQAVLPFRKDLEALHARIVAARPQQHKYWSQLMRDHSQGPLRSLRVLRTLLRNDPKSAGDPIISRGKYLGRRVQARVGRLRNVVAIRVGVRFHDQLPQGPYVYYPINYQPEAVLLATHPVLSDQLAVVRALSVSLPAGYQLVVKDNPFMAAGVRGPGFYRAIADLPNALMLRRDFDSIEVIKQASLVVTVSGHAGFEAACRMKKVLVLAPVHYDCLCNVWSLGDVRDLSATFKEMLFTPLSEDAVTRSIHAYLRTLLDVSYIEEETNLGDPACTARRLATLIERNLS